MGSVINIVADRPLPEDGVVHHPGVGRPRVGGRGHRKTDRKTDAGQSGRTHV